MRLIDADALKEKILSEGIASTYKNIQYAPTITAFIPTAGVTMIEAATDWHYIEEDGTPEAEGYYLITWEGIIGERYVSIAWYDADEKHFVDTCYHEDYYKVIAYAEPPKPAKRK